MFDPDLIPRLCATGDYPTWLNAPFVLDGRAMCCTGHLLAVIDADPESVEGRPQADSADIVRKMAGHLRADFDSIPATSIQVNLLECPDCKGSGYVISKECEDCDGKGWFNHGEHDYDCKACDQRRAIIHPSFKDAEGAAVCQNCKGDGRVTDKKPSPHGEVDRALSNECVRLLSGLPNCRISTRTHSVGSYMAYLFAADGVIGCVMPMRV